MYIFRYTAFQNKIVSVSTRTVMTQSAVIIIFIFATELFRVQSDLTQINPDKIIFRLYSGNRTTTFSTSKLTPEEIEAVDIMQPVIFIIPGWQTHINSTWIQNMTNLLIKKQPSNVITVDWYAYSKQINYPALTIQIGPIGDVVGDFIVNITRNNSDNLKKVHLIGHSLGAHITGYAGQRVYAKMKAKVARINGLDAAGPLFYLKPDNEKLSKDDAVRVDAIHTNGGRLGYLFSYGTSDFFPNGGGPEQPGCTNDSCSHGRSHEYYIESIVSNKFVAVQCPSELSYKTGQCNSNNKTIMGYDEPTTASGKYYLSTNADPPYAKGDVF